MKKSLVFLLSIFVCALAAVAASAQPSSNTESVDSGTTVLSASDIARQISEARRLLSSRQTSVGSGDLVTVAAFDSETSQTSTFSLPKNEFLVKDASLAATSQAGRTIRVRIVRANGVNTAMTVTDESTGRSLVPLLVQFPIVKGGAVSELAYYTSAHPSLLSPSLTTAGQTYVRKMLDAAAARLTRDR